MAASRSKRITLILCSRPISRTSKALCKSTSLLRSNLIDVIKLILEINSEVKDGEGVNFLTLRDDYQSVTGQDESLDKDRKYRITNNMNKEDRLNLLKEIEKFEDFRKRKCENLHVDYGYSLEYLSQKIPDIGLVKVKGNKIRPYGFTQLSVAIDLHGDIFLFREAGFLNREGNKKVIIGRLGHEKNSLEKNLRKFLESKKSIIFNETDDPVIALISLSKFLKFSSGLSD